MVEACFPDNIGGERNERCGDEEQENGAETVKCLSLGVGIEGFDQQVVAPNGSYAQMGSGEDFGGKENLEEVVEPLLPEGKTLKWRGVVHLVEVRVEELCSSSFIHQEIEEGRNGARYQRKRKNAVCPTWWAVRGEALDVEQVEGIDGKVAGGVDGVGPGEEGGDVIEIDVVACIEAGGGGSP